MGLFHRHDWSKWSRPFQPLKGDEEYPSRLWHQGRVCLACGLWATRISEISSIPEEIILTPPGK